MPFGTAGATLAAAAVDGALYCSLHSANPGASGANELIGDGYARQAVTMLAAANVVTNTDAPTFTVTADKGTVTHGAVWAAVSGGTPLYYGPLSSSFNFLTGTFTIQIGDLTFTVPTS